MLNRIIIVIIVMASSIYAAGSFHGLGISDTVYISGNGKVLFTSNSYYSDSQGWQSFSDGFNATSVTSDGSTFAGRVPATVTSPGLFPDDPDITFNTLAPATWNCQSGVHQLPFPPLLFCQTTASAISSNGSVVVGYHNNGLQSGGIYWNGSGSVNYLNEYSALAVSANGNTIAGYGTNEETFGPDISSDIKIKPYVWRADSGIEYLTEFDIEKTTYMSVFTKVPSAMHISDDGSTIIGTTNSRGFIWNESTGIEWVSTDNYQNVYALTPHDIVADGSVFVGTIGYEVHQDVGNGYTLISPKSETVIWDKLNGVRNLRDVLINEYKLAIDGWILTGASGISDDGTIIVGTGINPQGETETWIAVIPEPATFMLLLGGLILRPKKRFSI